MTKLHVTRRDEPRVRESQSERRVAEPAGRFRHPATQADSFVSVTPALGCGPQPSGSNE